MNVAIENATSSFVFTTMLHLGSMVTDDCDLCEPLREFLDDELDDVLAESLAEHIDLKRVVKEMEDGDDVDSALGELAWCCKEQDRWGFLVRIEAPETTKLPTGGKLVSRGIRRVRWFYGEDLLAIVNQADAWAASIEKEGPMPRFVEAPAEEDEDDD